MNKLPRREVLEEQAKAIEAAEAEQLEEGELEKVSGGFRPIMILMYGLGIGVLRKLLE